MSVTVRYNGTTKKLKVLPASPVQQLVDEAVQLFNLDKSGNFSLQHNKKIIDNSQPYRFAGISNNALLELVQGKEKKMNGGADTRIALSVEGVGQMSGTFRYTTPYFSHFYSHHSSMFP